MSQIPTYVTAVPNGTEKVRKISIIKKLALTASRVFTSLLTLGEPISESARFSYTETPRSALRNRR